MMLREGGAECCLNKNVRHVVAGGRSVVAALGYPVGCLTHDDAPIAMARIEFRAQSVWEKGL